MRGRDCLRTQYSTVDNLTKRETKSEEVEVGRFYNVRSLFIERAFTTRQANNECSASIM